MQIYFNVISTPGFTDGGGKWLETLAAYVIRDRWEGRRSVGEREREDLGDLILRVAGLEWAKTELLSD